MLQTLVYINEVEHELEEQSADWRSALPSGLMRPTPMRMKSASSCSVTQSTVTAKASVEIRVSSTKVVEADSSAEFESAFVNSVDVPERCSAPSPDFAERVALLYQYAHLQNMDIQHVHVAVTEAQAWQNKWADCRNEDPALFGYAGSSAAIDPETVCDPRQTIFGGNNAAFDGADEEELVEKKAFPVSPKKSLAAKALETVHEDEEEALEETVQILLRPVAIRVARPQAADFAYYLDMVPMDILRRFIKEEANDDEDDKDDQLSTMSPLTDAEEMDVSQRSAAMGGVNHYLSTMLNEQVHVIEDEDDVDDKDEEMALEYRIQEARDGILHAIAATGGEPSGELFQKSLETLQAHFETALKQDICLAENDVLVNGTWLTLTKPMFFGSVGNNDKNDPMYTLGRMSFDMFAPTNLICSLQGNFNTIERVCDDQERQQLIESGHVPKGFKEDVQNPDSVLRTYNIIAAFTIEPSTETSDYPDAPNKDCKRKIRAIMTTYGYTLPDPSIPNRQSVWITGGRIEPNNSPEDTQAWMKQFTMHPPTMKWNQRAKLLAVKLLMGAEVDTELRHDGALEYTFHKPLGGHGMAYVDTVYVDDTLRIVRGHRGTLFVFSRISGN